jgi:hypothetical protein
MEVTKIVKINENRQFLAYFVGIFFATSYIDDVENG